MSGHSKWSTIKHKKAATDARRGKLFTRLLREVSIAARLGGGDPSGNPRLRSAIQEAKGNNVPNDGIERAIKKGTGELGGGTVEEATYEGYASGGVAVLVEAVTDNRNRTASDVRHLFSRHGASLGEAGCVNWMFQKRGFFALQSEALSEDAFMELAIELGVDDFSLEDDSYELYTSLEDYDRVRQELEAREVPVAVRELSMVPQSYVAVDEESLPSILRLLEALEDHDDVQHVWANFDADTNVLARVSEAS